MAFAHELLEQAQHLAARDSRRPRQVNLRRAISNAYYALFHVLADAVASNWRPVRQRHDFTRLLQHGQMKHACEAIKRKNNQTAAIDARLWKVASAFVDLQQFRHTADYDASKTWSKSEVEDAIELAKEAIALWPLIANEPIAEDFLLSLLARGRA